VTAQVNVRHGKGSRRKGPKPRLVPLVNGADRNLHYAQEQQARDGFPGSWCRCPVPAQTLTRVQAARDIIADCGRQLNRPGNRAPGMLPAAEQIPKILGALALAYQQHPRWQEQRRP
jgi:hypothetical protein